MLLHATGKPHREPYLLAERLLMQQAVQLGLASPLGEGEQQLPLTIYAGTCSVLGCLHAGQLINAHTTRAPLCALQWATTRCQTSAAQTLPAGLAQRGCRSLSKQVGEQG